MSTSLSRRFSELCCSCSHRTVPLTGPIRVSYSTHTYDSRVRPKSRNDSSEAVQSPKSRPDWKHLPDWRRERLVVKHKLAHKSSSSSSTGPQDFDFDTSFTTNTPAFRRWTGSESAKPGYWDPRKRLSPSAMSGLRALHASDSETYDVPGLAHLFKISPDAVRRILRSKWVPTPSEAQARDERWRKRKDEIRAAANGERGRGGSEHGKESKAAYDERYKEQTGHDRNTVKANLRKVEESRRQFNVVPRTFLTDDHFV